MITIKKMHMVIDGDYDRDDNELTINADQLHINKGAVCNNAVQLMT